MSLRWLRLGMCGLIAVAIAGCGGSGGGMNCSGGASCVTGGNPTTVTVAFIGGTPSLVAAKIGTGAFTAQTLSGNTLNLSLPSGTGNFAVAYLCPPVSAGQAPMEYVWEASTADGTEWNNLYCNFNESTTPSLTGSLDASAISGVQSFWIDSQSASSTGWNDVTGGATANLSVYAPAGSDRVLVQAYAENLGPLVGAPLAAKNFDNQSVPGVLNGSSPVVFGAADETVPEAITYNDVPSGFANASTNVDVVLNGMHEFPYASGETTQYATLPNGAAENGDYYLLNGSASATGSAVYAGSAQTGGAASLSFPAAWSYSGPTPAALPSFTFNYTGFSGKSGVYQQVLFGFQPAGYTSTTWLQVDATASYQNGSTTLAVPDLSAVAGFLAPPASNTRVNWEAGLWQQSSPLTSFFPPLNATWEGVENGGTYTVP